MPKVPKKITYKKLATTYKKLSGRNPRKPKGKKK